MSGHGLRMRQTEGVEIYLRICADHSLWVMQRRKKRMIYCYCEGCKNHDDDDTCKLNSVTVSDRDLTGAGFLPICQDYEEDDE